MDFEQRDYCQQANTHRYIKECEYLRHRARILVQVTIYSRLLIGRDDHLDQSELVREYGPVMIVSVRVLVSSMLYSIMNASRAMLTEVRPNTVCHIARSCWQLILVGMGGVAEPVIPYR